MTSQQSSQQPETCIKHLKTSCIQLLKITNIPEGIQILCEAIPSLQGHLFSEEMDLISKAVPKRQMEFTAGRTLARRAMSHFGLQEQPILHNNRMPVWPEAVTGSISHCHTHCAVALGLRSSFISIGIDIETSGMVTPDLWEHTFTQREREYLSISSPARRDFLSTVIFSAKEAFFKLQFPLTGEWIGFDEACVEVQDDNNFLIKCNRSAIRVPSVLHGTIIKPLPGLVLSMLWLPTSS